jgi:hypothetical protein
MPLLKTCSWLFVYQANVGFEGQHQNLTDPV